MADLAEKDKHLLEVAFYENPFYFSYSSLSKLMDSPNIFYKEYILKEKEIKTDKYLLEGTLIHHLILEDTNFDDKFLVLTDDLPSDNSIKIAYQIFNIYKEQVKEDLSNESKELVDFPEEIDAILKEINLHQHVKDREKRLAKIIEPKTEAYFNFLKTKANKIIIDSEMLEKCTKAANLLKANSNITDLLGLNIEGDGVSIGIYNELELRMDLPNKPFGLQGIVDNLVVDVQNKLIRINDIKTSSKSLVDFPETVNQWKYWLQAGIYLKLVLDYLKDFIDDSWTIEIRFIVFDKYDQIYAFQVGNESLIQWIKQTDEVIEKAVYHYQHRDYSLPYEFITSEVTL